MIRNVAWGERGQRTADGERRTASPRPDKERRDAKSAEEVSYALQLHPSLQYLMGGFRGLRVERDLIGDGDAVAR